MVSHEKIVDRRLWTWIGLGLAVAVGLFLAVAYLLVPEIAKSQLTRVLEEQTGLSPTIERVHFDPFRFRLSVTGFELREDAEDTKTSPLIAFDALVLDVRLMGFLNSDLALDELRLLRPRVSAVIDQDRRLNLQALFESEADRKGPEESSPDRDAILVDVDLIRIEKGELLFRDLGFASPFELLVAPLDSEVSDFTTRPGQSFPYELRFALEGEAQSRWSGRVGLDPLTSEGEVEVTNFDLTAPSGYLRERVRFGVREGEVNLSATYDLSVEDAFDFQLSQGALDFSQITLFDPAATEEADFVALSSLSISGIEAVASGSALDSLSVDEVALAGGRLEARIEEGGQVRLAQLFTPIAEATPNSNSSENVSPDEPGRGSSPTIRVGKISARELTIDFDDRSAPRPVRVQVTPFGLELTGFDSEAGSKLDLQLDAGFPNEGNLVVSGPIGLEPLDARLKITATDLALEHFGPYLNRWARVDVSSGSLSGQIEISVAERDEVSPDVTGKGRLVIKDLGVVDPGARVEVFRWKSLRLEGIELAKDGIQLDEIGIEGAFARIELGSDGQTNLENLLIEPPSGEPREGQPGNSEFAIHIKQVRLDAVGLNLSDLSIEPPFVLDLDRLSGTVEGLSSTSGSRANVALEGRVDQTAPLTISGSIDPFSGQAYTDLAIGLKGMSMPNLAPYSGRYVGYGIDRGKLDLELDYKLSARTLKAKNHFSLDRFAFGGKVESDQATSLPVPLAMAIMRDARGRIEIDLPIQGNLDDPSFNVLGLLTKSFVNLIARVAAAPFSVIGGILGASAEDLSRVLFAPGSDQLTPKEKLEIDRLAEALVARPGLRIEIRGRADPAADGPAFADGMAEPGESEWRSLARARADTVQSVLLASEGIVAERIFLAEVEIGPVAEEGGIPIELSLGVR